MGRTRDGVRRRPELLVLGLLPGFWSAKPYVIPAAALTRHLWAIGPTGSGKSVLLTNLAYQVAAFPSRRSLVVIDIKDGTLCEDILQILPAERLADCIYVNFADTQFPVAFNPLAAVPAAGRTLAASELVSCFRRLFGDAWGPRLEYVLLMVTLTLLEVPDATLIDVPRILTDAAYRSWAVTHVSNFSVQQFWANEFPAIVGKNGSTANVQSLLNKLGIFAFEEVRNVLGQSRRGIDVRTCMDTGKILLCNVPQGVLGEAASTFLAALLATRVQLAAQARADTAREQRPLTVLIADEFQNFVAGGGTFEKSVTEGRSLQLAIVAACQFPQQLPPALRLTLEKNCQYLLTCLRRQNQHLVRITPLQEENAELLTVEAQALPPLPNTRTANRGEVQDRTRQAFARPKPVVEAEIAARQRQPLAPARATRSARPSEVPHAYQFYEEDDAP